MEGLVYKITNTVNNKAYIGKTYRALERRFKEHVSDASRYDRPLHRALRKYGASKFTIELLGIFNETELEIKEQEFIEKYETFKYGYNATRGGDGTRYLKYSDEEVIEAYKNSQNIRDVSRNLKIDQGTISKILKAHNIEIKLVKLNEKRVKINGLNLEFDSVHDVARHLINAEVIKEQPVAGITRHIRQVCNGDRKTAYTFSYSWI